MADWAYHEIKGNPHVHIMSALRPLTDEGFGAKTFARLMRMVSRNSRRTAMPSIASSPETRNLSLH